MVGRSGQDATINFLNCGGHDIGLDHRGRLSCGGGSVNPRWNATLNPFNIGRKRVR
jgi:hypothetical protein